MKSCIDTLKRRRLKILTLHEFDPIDNPPKPEQELSATQLLGSMNPAASSQAEIPVIQRQGASNRF